jgi:putative hydrolase of the HAD superfamily
MRILVLDAMGVIYSVSDDVLDLLCPFIEEKRGVVDYQRIESLYRAASLGRISAAQFWQTIGIDPALEDEYVARHRLSTGLIEFLQKVSTQVASVWCLSNDVTAWSVKLRQRFELSRFVKGFVVSGDVGARKPDRVIYERLLEKVRVEPADILFVDDRVRNLDTAATLGMETVLFTADHSSGRNKHRVVSNFQELYALVLHGSK